MSGNMTMLLGYAAMLIFVGWVLYVTQSAWSLFLLIAMPTLGRSKDKDGS